MPVVGGSVTGDCLAWSDVTWRRVDGRDGVVSNKRTSVIHQCIFGAHRKTTNTSVGSVCRFEDATVAADTVTEVVVDSGGGGKVAALRVAAIAISSSLVIADLGTAYKSTQPCVNMRNDLKSLHPGL